MSCTFPRGQDPEGQSNERQPHISGLPQFGERPHIFPGREAVFISARVHPGETPSSFILEGLLSALAGTNKNFDVMDLLRKYIFFIIPVLNPDGVALGYCRSDTRGINLNRVYGSSNASQHPSIFAAEGACAMVKQCQGSLRLYLDMHAHSSRRGAFLLGSEQTGAAYFEAKLYCYSLARRCSFFEYAQCLFTDFSEGTAKRVMSSQVSGGLCFTLESNYSRTHHSTRLLTPADWRTLGACCVEALKDIDLLQKVLSQPLPAITTEEGSCTEAASGIRKESMGLNKAKYARQVLVEDLRCAEQVLTGLVPALTVSGPSRAQPWFAQIKAPSEDFSPSPQLWLHEECFGQDVELTERLARETGDVLYKAEISQGALWLQTTDIVLKESMSGRFLYRAVKDTPVSEHCETDSKHTRTLPKGTLLEADERRVVDGRLRLHIVADDADDGQGEFSNAGWANEFLSACFDPRLGGDVQLLRLGAPSRNRVN